MEVLSFMKMVLMMLMMMMMMMGNMVKCELHNVGGNKTSWAPNVNMTEWSSHEHFHVGDWLYFGYDRHMYNVLEVNKTGYDNCIDTGFMKNITGGAGRDVFNLTETKTYYFLSGGGFCWHGMKVAINVVASDHDVPSPAPAPVPLALSPKSHSAPAFHINQTQMVLILVLVLIFPFI